MKKKYLGGFLFLILASLLQLHAQAIPLLGNSQGVLLLHQVSLPFHLDAAPAKIRKSSIQLKPADKYYKVRRKQRPEIPDSIDQSCLCSGRNAVSDLLRGGA